MTGTIKEIRLLPNGKTILLYNDINTSGGQSGSPVFLIREEKYYLIGIHVGTANGMNVATGITKELRKWIK